MGVSMSVDIKKEIIDRFNRLGLIGAVNRYTGMCSSIVGSWTLQRDVYRGKVTILAAEHDKLRLLATWDPSKHIYDYKFLTYEADVCETALLATLREAFVLEDLSAI